MNSVTCLCRLPWKVLWMSTSTTQSLLHWVTPNSIKFVQNTVASTAEALTSLHLALEMKLSGKQKKAIKLFQHAVALAPCHPDVLNHYGEFLEHTQNIIKLMIDDEQYN